jgi:hypothetical protein
MQIDAVSYLSDSFEDERSASTTSFVYVLHPAELLAAQQVPTTAN